ncbi:MAG: hypothetical protein RL077_346 [Verrucomicrobiota bacterium]|jgi:hypothetical protein
MSAGAKPARVIEVLAHVRVADGLRIVTSQGDYLLRMSDALAAGFVGEVAAARPRATGRKMPFARRNGGSVAAKRRTMLAAIETWGRCPDLDCKEVCAVHGIDRFHWGNYTRAGAPLREAYVAAKDARAAARDARAAAREVAHA